MRISLDLEPKPDAEGVPHVVTLSLDDQVFATGHGDSDISAMRDLLGAIVTRPEISNDILGAICGSFRSALMNEHRAEKRREEVRRVLEEAIRL